LHHDLIKESPELAAVASRWVVAFQNKDRGALTNLFSATEHVRYLGTAPGEFWSGAVLRDGFADHVEEVPDFAIRHVDIEAFECGNVGWASWIGEMQFDVAGSESTTRYTWVFVLEDSAWKIAHVHVSNPMSNIDKMGIEHSALDELVLAAKEGYTLVGGEETATVMFTDVAGSSSIANLVGDRVWASTINRHFETVTEVVERNDGHIVKTLGDGTMATFSSARAAMTAAKAVQKMVAEAEREPRLEVRIGIHTGDVIETDGDFFGNVVNKAARITAAANPGQMLVSDVTRGMVESGGGFEFESPVSVMLRGIEGNHSISTLNWL
jgi:class 3 adenylate cyclase/ketosteroid isomerase-like protein